MVYKCSQHDLTPSHPRVCFFLLKQQNSPKTIDKTLHLNYPTQLFSLENTMRNFFRFVGWLPFPGKFHLRKLFYKFHQSDNNEDREAAYENLKHSLVYCVTMHTYGFIGWGLCGYLLFKDHLYASIYCSAFSFGMFVVTWANIRLLRSVMHDRKHAIRKQLTGSPEGTGQEKNLALAFLVTALTITFVIAGSV